MKPSAPSRSNRVSPTTLIVLASLLASICTTAAIVFAFNAKNVPHPASAVLPPSHTRTENPKSGNDVVGVSTASQRTAPVQDKQTAIDDSPTQDRDLSANPINVDALNANLAFSKVIFQQDRFFVQTHSDIRDKLSVLNNAANDLLQYHSIPIYNNNSLAAYNKALDDAISSSEKLANKTSESPESIEMARQIHVVLLGLRNNI